MNRFFNMDNKFFVFMGRVADLLLLNFLCILCCIPVVTAGASITALYYVTLKMARDEESYIARSFFHSFKQNFKQATIINIIMLLTAAVLFIDLRIARAGSGAMYKGLFSLFIAFALIYAMILLYIYPILSKFFNSVKNTFVNAFLMSVRHLPLTLLMLVISASPLLLMWLFAYVSYAQFTSILIMLFILMGFSTLAYWKSKIFVKIFDNYIPKDENEENGGMSCPNRDGTLGKKGCIFCSRGGSGDFAANAALSITEQINTQIKSLSSKRPIHKYIAYFQAYTNTYAPVEHLRKIFTEAISHPDIVALSIGTRPDCLGDDVLDLLYSLNQIKPVWVELGLQTIHEDTARYIRRGYPLSCFDTAVKNLRAGGIEVIVHTILGLPGESRKDILETMAYLNAMDIQGIKLQLLHVLRGTDLAADHEAGLFRTYERDEYLNLVIDCLEHLRPDIVIHRVTGDGPKDLLIAPLWASRKREVLNLLHHRMKERASFQGKALEALSRSQ